MWGIFILEGKGLISDVSPFLLVEAIEAQCLPGAGARGDINLTNGRVINYNGRHDLFGDPPSVLKLFFFGIRCEHCKSCECLLWLLSNQIY